MRKKKVIIIFLVIITISIPSLLYVEYRHKLTISENLFKDYLNNYIYASKSENEKLLDYRIKEMGMTNLLSSNFTFTVTFSVKPASVRNTNYWAAGNGSISDDGWIDDKYIVVSVNKRDGKYVITNMGNG